MRRRRHTPADEHLRLVSRDTLSRLLSEQGPADPLAEQAVLATMLTSEASLAEAAGALDLDDFAVPVHRRLFAEAVRLWREGKEVTTWTLRDRLTSEELAALAAAQGVQSPTSDPLAALERLASATVGPRALRERCGVVREMARRRRLRAAAIALLETCQEERQLALLDVLLSETAPSTGIRSIDEVLQGDSSVAWLVEPLIPLRNVTLLLADVGMRKSWLAQSLFHSLGRGLSYWLGYRIATPGAALYLDGEMDEPEVRERLRLLDLAAGVEPDPWAEGGSNSNQGYLWFDPDVRLGPRVGRLEGLIRETRARLVVFDSVTALSDLRDPPYRVEFWSRAMPPLIRLARRTECAILLVHHLRNVIPGADNSLAGRAFGGAQVMRAAASAIGLDGEKGDAPKVLRHLKCRLAPHREPPFYLTFTAGPNGQGVLLTRGARAPDERGAHLEDVRAMVLEALPADKPVRRADLVTYLRDLADGLGNPVPSVRTVAEALSLLVEEGAVERTGRGCYRRLAAPAAELSAGAEPTNGGDPWE